MIETFNNIIRQCIVVLENEGMARKLEKNLCHLLYIVSKI